jgi:maltose O-acetyltransferase
VPYFFDFGESSMASIRKLPKALRSPRDAMALINAQLHLRGKAKLPLSVRLAGRIILTGEGQVELGNGVSFVGTVVPIEIASRKGARISIGDHTFINYGALISACKHIEIGQHCFLGHYTFLLGNKEYDVEQDDVPSSPSIMIGDHAWIGSHVTVLPGVSIGHHAAVGAGSVVAKSIPPHCLAVGNPARIVRELDGALHDPDVRVVQRSMEPT